MFQEQYEVEEYYSKGNITKWIEDSIKEDVESTAMFRKACRSIERYIHKDYYLSKNKRISVLTETPTEEIALKVFMVVFHIFQNSEPIQGVATALGLEFTPNQLDAVKTGGELLAVCESCGLYDILSYSDEENEHDTASIVPNFEVDADIAQKIHNTQYLPPMICAPRDWTENRKGGYLQRESSCILGNGNHHKMEQSLDVLNILQAIPYRLNVEMLSNKEEMKKEPDIGKYSEGSTLYIEAKRKVDQHNARCRQSDQVYTMMLDAGNKFWLVWKYDKRGRSYSQGYDVNLQGSEYKKSIIEFAHEEIVEGF